jgi:citrate lyase subunit beta / citryl-CoA lyase
MPAHSPAEAAAGMRLRSLLFVPGDRPERMDKAAVSGADALILDLEDSVAVSHKAAARDAVAAFLAQHRTLPLFVRINPLDGPYAQDDLDTVLSARPDGVVLPKAEGAASVLDLKQRLQDAGAQALILPIATETAGAVFRLGEYATVAEGLAGLTWGAEDLSAAVGAATAREPSGAYAAPYDLARSLTLFGAHAAGVPAIETVYPDFRDLDGLAAYAGRGARDGFSGMMAIHPTQVAVINAAFSPSAEALEWAQRVVDAFVASPDSGALSLDGKMIDAPHLKQARRLLALP